jgi:hypothetical protein
MKKQTKLSLVLLLIVSAIAFDCTFSSCSESSQGAPTTSTATASRVATSSTGESIYIATDANDFQNALTLAETVRIDKIINASPTEIAGDFKTKKPKSKKLTIECGSIKGSISRELPQTQGQAVDSIDNWYQYQFAFESISFTGSGSNGINMNCAYTSVRDCYFNGKDTAINLVFCMNAQIINNQVINSKKGGICLNVGTGKWQGAGNSTSASNHPYLEGNRVFNMEGAEFGLALISASGYWIQNHISEGKRPMYHIIDNDLNSTTVLNGGGNNIHLESQATVAGVLIKSRQGIKDYTSLYPQYPMTLFDVQSYAGAVQVNVNNLCWIPSGTKFACTGNIRYRFGNLYNQLRVDTATMWVNSKFPNVLCQENLTANGLVTKNYVNGKLK